MGGQVEFFLWIDKPALRALKELATRHDQSTGAEIRAILDEALKKAGLLPVNPSTAAADVDADAEQHDDCRG